MTAPAWLCPRTLRWLAEDEDRQAAWWRRRFGTAGDNTFIFAQRAHRHVCRAKRLRNLATRAEKRGGK